MDSLKKSLQQILLANFGNFWAIFGENRAFSLAARFFPWRTVFLYGQLTLIAKRINLADG